MGYHAPVKFIDKFAKGKSRLIRKCIRCANEIQKDEIRIYEKRNGFFCFHEKCFEEEYPLMTKTKGGER